ncbi:MAG: indolepyruvate oxidoreductase subunit beta [Candidatus Sumerlaeota bacterium]|nr:indolepyruvate oxidoreductase subunit beta [Candidatus Sumerlaeota bacterium]
MTMGETTNIVLAGVGGQGILLASRLICEAALAEGYDVKANEVHGMAQRGGSVIGQIRFGKKVYSPLVKLHSVNYLLAMEIIEAVRYADYLAPDGLALINTQRIIPTTVSSGQADYPAEPEMLVKETFERFQVADCLKLALEAGDARCTNVVMVGWLSRHLSFKEKTWQVALERSVKKKFLAINQKAFALGQAL